MRLPVIKNLLLYGYKKAKNCSESSPQVYLGLKFISLIGMYFDGGTYLGFKFLSVDEQCSL